jgi:hypothetical protein
MKVEKQKFDDLLGKLLKAKPTPRKTIKARSKHGTKVAIIQPKKHN